MDPRARLELRDGSASPEEAVAVVAAIEQFLRDTAPGAPAPAGRGPRGASAWLTAARLEAAGERGPHPWSAPARGY